MARKSTLGNLVVTLVVITVFSAVGLGGMNVLTKEPIEAAKSAKVISALQEVLPEFDNNPAEEMREVEVEGGVLRVYPATLGGEHVGMAVESFSHSGFGGTVAVMVGFTAAGEVSGYSVLEHAETPGLGDKMVDWFKPPVDPARSLVERIFGFTVPVVERSSNIYGKNPSVAPLVVANDGGDVDAITAATISSRAFLDAVNRAAAAVSGDVSAVSGATPNVNQTEECNE